jgi:hypothetical protein
MLDKTQRFSFTIEGISPLLTSNPQSMLSNGHAKPTRGAVIYDPHEEAEARVYRSPEGYCSIPAIAIRNAIIASASFAKIKRVPLRQLLAHIQLEPAEFLAILNPIDMSPVSEYEIDLRRAMIQRAGVMRARPMFRQWALQFDILADVELLPSANEILITQLTEAGGRIGIGDYRPSKSGPFGRFKVI